MAKIMEMQQEEINKIALYLLVIEKVSNNAVFQEVMSDVKEEFFVDDKVHGITHNERVTLMACYIGMMENLDETEMKDLLCAALYHDIGRKVIPKGTRGIGRQHGFKSAEILERKSEELLPNMSDEDIKIIKGLCMAHSVDNSEIENVLKENGIRVDNKIRKLINILKDADALDMVRLPHGKLDEMENQIEAHLRNAPENVKQIIKRVESATSIEETKAILLNIFRDYLATPEQSEKIKKWLQKDREYLEKQKKEKYSINVFESKPKVQNTINTQLPAETKHQSIFWKIINKIKKIFNI